ncbi:hypothetical protein SEA_SKOG_120 [Gordonia phage Skog]|uniref:Uncharacterized protein n=1 Tax=Gordonia phage Skog TaxID=2704033 RepID=A0A6G6XJJ6_9CAUD|nr:HNH endonuclease [Gordonia phage Skog]QIG58272.1 hypothetical protein SEA_SKOG_120 [Gordonia phage Skog]
MDPDKTLARIRKLVEENRSADLSRGEVDALTGLFENLDEWMTKGGFAPTAWRADRQPTQPIKVHDYVVPIMEIEIDDELVDVSDKMTRCQVTHIYKNGKIRAVSDDGAVRWLGEASGFRLAR